MYSFKFIRYAKEYLFFYFLLTLVHHKTINIVASIALLCVVFFFRKSNFSLPKEITYNSVVAPCYGKIKEIVNNEDYLFIKIHLRIFDQHYFIHPTFAPNVFTHKKEYQSDDLERLSFYYSNGLVVSSIVKKLNKFGNLYQDFINLITFKSMYLPSFIYQDRIINLNNQGIGSDAALIRFGSECQILFKKNGKDVFLFKNIGDTLQIGERLFEIL